MTRKYIRLIAGVSLAVCWQCAISVTLSVENGILVGAFGVSVDDNLYDVEFIDGDLNSIYSGGLLTYTAQFASSASQALVDSVFVETASPLYDSTPNLTQGCSFTYCVVYTPTSSIIAADTRLIFGAINYAGAYPDSITSYASNAYFGTLDVPFGVWGRWTPTAIPTPASITNIGLGLLLLASLEAKRRKLGCRFWQPKRKPG